jgi:flavin reductase (DIM6/NTAB) family NADH-FMN oxidoreductase RutF
MKGNIMEKVELIPQPMIPACPVLVVGALVDGKPNFMVVGGGGIVSTEPQLIALPIRHHRLTLKGIKVNKTLSVNIPSVALAMETDYIGIVSGADADKVEDCNFDVFYGKLKTAPMIKQFPICKECSVYQILETKSHTIVIAETHAIYVSSEYVKNGNPAFDELEPLLWFPARGDYVGVGKSVGKVRSLGKELKVRKAI